MKTKWSREWISSKQPRKQRKYRYNAPLHIRRKFVSAHLSPELRNKYGIRSIPIRKGDEVEVMRGSSKGLRGTVERVDLSKCKVYVSGITVKKADGSEVMRALEPSNLKIVNMNLDDKKRLEAISRAKSNIENSEKKDKVEKKKTEKSYKTVSKIDKERSKKKSE